MAGSFIYQDILADLGWFDAKETFSRLDDVNFVHHINGVTEINADTTIAYFPGCFAHFHEGHVAVIDEMKHKLSKETDNYIIVIAPANTDYTVSKYGADSIYASNKYRFDRITSVLDGYEGNVAIDLNPMLNNDRDFNFTDLIKDFVERHVKNFDDLKQAPYIVCGKDRDYFRNLEKLTNKIRVFYVDDTTQKSSSSWIKDNPKVFQKKTCYLRCSNFRQYTIFEHFFADQYTHIKPVLLSEELKIAREMSLKADVTICKEYADILPYVPFHRDFKHPLITKNRHIGDMQSLKGKVVLDSDVFTGSTKDTILKLGGTLLTVMDFSMNQDTREIVDFSDFYDDRYRYPFYDISTRCSMMPFTNDDHKRFKKFKNKIKKGNI